MAPHFYKATTAAQALGVSSKTVVSMIRRGDLAGVKHAGQYLIPRSDLDRFIQARTHEAMAGKNGGGAGVPA